MRSENIPRHVAIIMDGNGRWAGERGLERIEGHKRGAESVKRALEACSEVGVKYLTLYAFSTENWKRSKYEVNALMMLLETFLKKNQLELMAKDIRLRAIGEISQLPAKAGEKLRETIEMTKGNHSGQLILALSYGARKEIVRAAARVAAACQRGEINVDVIDEELFGQYLYAPDIPDPDLLIRTGGEFRVSNFLLWQIAYAEICVMDKHWPDFTKEDFFRAVESFQNRERRFGGVK